MGSEFMSLDEAALRLKRTKRTIHNYRARGLLRKATLDGDVVLYREDVEQLAVDLGSGQPPMNRQTFYALCGEVRQLQEKVALLQRMQGVGSPPLRPTPQEAIALMSNLTHFLGQEAWSYEHLEAVTGGVFERVDEETLTILSRATGIPDPWEPIWRLATRMMEFMSLHPDFPLGLALPALHRRMQLARQRLRKVMVLWMEMTRGAKEGMFRAPPENEKEAVLALLKPPKGKKG